MFVWFLQEDNIPDSIKVYAGYSDSKGWSKILHWEGRHPKSVHKNHNTECDNKA